MKNQRLFILAGATALVILLSNVLNATVSTSRFNESYPATVCPPNTTGLSTAISLTSPKTEVRKTGTSSMKTSPVGFRRYAIAAQSAVIESGPVTPIVWQVRKGVWAGAVPCLAPISSQWFVGATADITTKGSLNIVNSGLGRALVEIAIYTEKGALTPRSISMKPNSYQSIPLASLAPGSKEIAIHLLPRSGRVNGFVVDERGKGLQALGGDLVNSTSAPVKNLVIPAIPQQTGKKSATPHTLRLLVPGDVDARISAEIKSTDGTFSPVSINGRVIPHTKVIEIPLEVTMASGKFALHISSDQPILGSVFSRTLSQGKRDFVWSTAATQLTEFTLATTGLAPTLVFTGGEIKVNLSLTYTNGSTKKQSVEAEDIATFVVPDSVRSVTFTKISSKTTGAALISSKSGYGYIPLNPGSILTKSSVPASNIRVLNP
ncbi:MAG: hypothetical protein RL381_131 [Actinomycetota bacterium]|jgi:hypothetical protein